MSQRETGGWWALGVGEGQVRAEQPDGAIGGAQGWAGAGQAVAP
ncbi:MAG TPA: hypothetical protein VFM49_28965 [Chloroflexia bacterium]|nr:hypothetical protein [Chloroflexia bacterium]